MLEKIIRRLRVTLPFIYTIIFQQSYIYVISRTYGYLGSYLQLNESKLTWSWISIILLILLMELQRESKLKSIYRLMMYFSIIPSLCFYGLKDENTEAFLLIFFYWLMWSLVIIIMDVGGYTRRLRSDYEVLPDANASYIKIAFYVASLITFFFWVRYGGMRLFLSFSEVYDVRNTNTSMNSLEAYIFVWCTHVIFPCLMYIFFMERKYLKGIICFVMLILSYTIYGNKSMFFTAIFVIGVIVLSRFKLQRMTDVVIGLFLSLYQLICFASPARFFVALAHRLLTVPSEAHYYYYDFFQSHPLLYLRQSILRHFVSTSYDRPVSLLIGGSSSYYTGASLDDMNNVNNGLFSDAYQNFGSIGVFIYPIIIVCTYYILLKLLRNYDQGFQYVILLITSLYLLSAYYFSWLLSGGVIVLVIALKYANKRISRTTRKIKMQIEEEIRI